MTRVAARPVHELHWVVAYKVMRDGQVLGRCATAVDGRQRTKV